MSRRPTAFPVMCHCEGAKRPWQSAPPKKALPRKGGWVHSLLRTRRGVVTPPYNAPLSPFHFSLIFPPRKRTDAFCRCQIRKFLCRVRCNSVKWVTPYSFFLCYKAEVLRVCPYFLHHSKYFLFGWNIYHTNRSKVNIYLYITMTA